MSSIAAQEAEDGLDERLRCAPAAERQQVELRHGKLVYSIGTLYGEEPHGATASTLPKPAKTSLQSTRLLDPTAIVHMV